MDEDENISLLLSMGFPNIGEIKRALRLAKNDISEAVAILTNDAPMASYGSSGDVGCDIDMKEASDEDKVASLEFPGANLYELERRVFQDNWSIPYKRDESLGKCLLASTKLAREGLLTDEAMDAECRKFIDCVMPEAFKKLLTSNATSKWHSEIQEGIYTMLDLFLDLILARLPHPPIPVSMLNTLALSLDLDNDWNYKNRDQMPMGREQHYTSTSLTASKYGWACDLINRFGEGGGFALLAECSNRESVTGKELTALINVLANCAEVLNKDVLQPILLPCRDRAFLHVSRMTEADLKTKEATAISDLLAGLRLLCHFFWPDKSEECVSLRLELICRMLKTPQFNTRMNGLKEVSRLIAESEQGPLNYRHRTITNISADVLVDWMADNKVLSVALEGNIDQAQYTDRIKAIVEFLCPRLQREDLDKIWRLHDASSNSQIMENVHTIMASAASKFNLEQYEYLTSLIKAKWEASNDRVREKLLLLIGQIGREAKQAKSIQATLQLLWEVSHLETLPRQLVERALAEQLAIITEMNLNRDALRKTYINECLEDIKKANKANVLPAVIHLHKLCKSYSKASTSSLYQKADKATLSELSKKHEIVKLLSCSLSRAHQWACEAAAAGAKKSSLSKHTIVDGRYSHEQFIDEHLQLMKFFLQEGDLYLSWGRTKELWDTLVENPRAIEFDKESCLAWFKDCLNDLENDTQLDFFKQKLLSIAPCDVSACSFECFMEYLESVNINAGKMRKNAAILVVESQDLIGIEYLWTLVTDCPHEGIAEDAIEYLLKLSFLNVTNKLKKEASLLHKKFVANCYDQLEAVIEVSSLADGQEAVHEGCELETSIAEGLTMHTTTSKNASSTPFNAKGIRLQMIRRLIHLAERYVFAVEETHPGCRTIYPHANTFYGHPFRLKVLYETKKEEFFIESHSNEMIRTLKREISERLMHNVSDLTFNCGDQCLGSTKDSWLVISLGKRDEMQVWSVKLNPIHASTSSSVSVFDEQAAASTSAATQCLDTRQAHMEDMEKNLPGVIIANEEKVFPLLYKLGMLRDPKALKALRKLFHLLPTDTQVVESFASITYGAANSAMGTADASPKMSPRKASTSSIGSPETAKETLHKMFDITIANMSPFRILYNLEVLSGLLMPTTYSVSVLQFSSSFLHSGGLRVVLRLFEKDALPCDMDYEMRQSVYTIALQVARFLLCGQGVVQRSVSHAAKVVTSPLTKPTPPKKSALDASVAKSPLALSAHKIVQMPELEFLEMTTCLVRLVWAAGAGNLQLATSRAQERESSGHPMKVLASRRSRDSSTGSSTSSESGGLLQDHHPATSCSGGGPFAAKSLEVHDDDARIATEAFDLLTTCLQLRAQNISAFFTLPYATEFIIETLLGSASQLVRSAACVQLQKLARIRAPGAVRALSLDELVTLNNPLSSRYMLTKLVLKAPVPLWMPSCKARGLSHILLGQCQEYFDLRCSLLQDLSKADQESLGENAKSMLDDELSFLHNYAPCSRLEDCTLLAGHLRLVEALLSADGVSAREVGATVIGLIMDSYLFPASKMISEGALSGGGGSGEITTAMVHARNINPRCDTPESRVAAYSLLTKLSKDCSANLSMVVNFLVKMHHTYDEGLAKEFSYEPLVERRAACNYVGLKNAGATCYMNSVLQQLFCVPGLGDSVLSCHDEDDAEDFLHEDECIFYQLQNLFGHLRASKLQYYVPDKFWHNFRLFGKKVNVREQQDAFEFYTQIIDQVDELLASKKRPKIFTNFFEGTFSDQMICQDCPHRYEREQPFMALNLTIKSNSLLESLDQFVRGELLDGDNAYFCEKCQEKRSTIKRMCIRSLPKTLVIQLKRFHYDWETNRAVKFDDYFEFPWCLEMGPYTTEGIRQAEKEAASEAANGVKVKRVSIRREASFQYDLVGVVVHSGQANAGHYYSLIKDRYRTNKWFKFNDTTVDEFEMTEDSLKQECFGGTFKVKKGSSGSTSLPEDRQRYWNAYMLFYESKAAIIGQRRASERKMQTTSTSIFSLSSAPSVRKTSTPAAPPRESLSQLSDLLEKGEKTGLFHKNFGGRMPPRIEQGIQEENLRFLLNRDVYCDDYYKFISNLVSANLLPSTKAVKLNETLAEQSVTLATHFLLNTYAHMKRRDKSMMNDLLDAVEGYIEASALAAQSLLAFLASTEGLRYIRPFLLECPIKEVRTDYLRLLERSMHYYLAHFKTTDCDLVERLLSVMVNLIKEDVANHIKSSAQFFAFITKFARLGQAQCEQLLRRQFFEAMSRLLLGTDPEALSAAGDDGVTTLRQRKWAQSQSRELGDLHTALSTLVLSCDTSTFRGTEPGERMEKKTPIPPGVSAILYGQIAPLYIREAVSACREVVSSAVPTIIQALAHSMHSSATFSRLLIEELMKQYNSVGSGELKNLSTLLVEVLTLPDELQGSRLDYAMDGNVEQKIDGLLEVVDKHQTCDSCRAYQCIKTLVTAANKSGNVKEKLLQDAEKWQWAVNWLREKIDQDEAVSTTSALQPSTSLWATDASNEDSLTKTFHRTTSALVTLEEANAILAEFDQPPPASEGSQAFMETEDGAESTIEDIAMPPAFKE